MQTIELRFQIDIYDSIDHLDPQDAMLLREAGRAAGHAYAPYSHFRVGAAARLANGSVVMGNNQENASFPAGLCAERVMLATISSTHPGVAIDTIAITSLKPNGDPGDHPISPCGICRQSLQEYQYQTKKNIRLVLGGPKGKIYVLPDSGILLPLAFTGTDLG
jgi:cytidine deaminase